MIFKRTWIDEEGNLREEEIDPRDVYIRPSWWQHLLWKLKFWLLTWPTGTLSIHNGGPGGPSQPNIRSNPPEQ